MIAFAIIIARRRSLPDLAGCADFFASLFSIRLLYYNEKIGIDDDGFGHCCQTANLLNKRKKVAAIDKIRNAV